MLSFIIKRGKKLLQSEAGFVVMKWRNYYYKIKQLFYHQMGRY